MPCYDDQRSFYSSNLSIKNAEQDTTINRLESLLCSACRVLSKTDYDFDTNPALSEWWDKHKKKDEEKNMRELKEEFEKRSIEAALKKSIDTLLPSEIALLKKHKYL